MSLVKEILTEPEIANAFSVEQLPSATAHTTVERLRYHRIFLIEQGQGKLIIDDNSFNIQAHQAFLLSKGQIYSLETSSNITGYSISFGDCFWENTPRSASNCKAVLFNNTTANQHLSLDKSEWNALSFISKTLLEEYQSANYINQMDVVAAYLKIMMIKLANVKITDETTFDSQDYLLYRKFMELLSAQFRDCHSVNEYAKLLHITGRRLSELCKRCSGMTAKEIINGQLIAEAKRSLQFSATPIKEIAFALHFTSAEQFSHFFKTHAHISPLEYRNQFVTMGA